MKPKIDYKEIIKLIDLLEEKKLYHFELETEGFKIRIGRNQPQAVIQKGIPVHETAPPPAGEAIPEEPSTEETPGNNLHYVVSPMVGTFYRAPDPSSEPFIEIGEPVQPNQTMCIIEAMKLMNEIEADVSGVVEDILVKNGEPVEYGQKLFAVKPK
ncbi:MAG: acetyl-CoA carboxylase biotin carboxyl carrier protein [Candidatus Aminicenantes bacterium]